MAILNPSSAAALGRRLATSASARTDGFIIPPMFP
jgi:hypothetical protein